ncbi:poly polymerase catalytic domain-containing protein [Phlyctochytrium arcticum]|nr:poly polymerase catalytic domain-containing protein [Phlyctochytrium arcticum]
MAGQKEGELRVEYAKSGRSMCKGCRSTISAGTVRIGYLKASAFFDGLQPEWHHKRCLLQKTKKYKLQTAHLEHAHGINDLRWEDQESLKETARGMSAPNTSNEAGSSSSKGQVKPAEPPQKKSTAGQISRRSLHGKYSGKGAGPCAGCAKNIRANTLILGIPSENPESHESMDKTQNLDWYHLDCFTNRPDTSEYRFEDLQWTSEWKRGHEKKVKSLLVHENDDRAGEEPQKATLQEDSEDAKSKGKRKRSHPENEGEESDGKRAKSDDASNQLRDQSNLLWTVQDSIKRALGSGRHKQRLLSFLHHNTVMISDRPTESDIIKIVADVLVFGVAEICSECGESRLAPRTFEYRCPVWKEWGQCTSTSDKPKFSKFKIPSDMEDETWLQVHPFVRCNRVFPVKPDSQPDTAAATIEDSTRTTLSSKPMKSKTPFKNYTIAVAGKLDQTQAQLQQLIESAGGTYSKAINPTVQILISNQQEIAKKSTKIRQAKDCRVDIVDQTYIYDCCAQESRLDYRKAPYILSQQSEEPSAAGSKKAKVAERQIKAVVLVKDGAVVDPNSDLAETHHVLRRHGLLYSVVLSRTDVERNLNMYYKLQVLESDRSKNDYYLFRSWGRVGTNRGGTKLEEFDSAEDAQKLFCQLYEEKSGNIFGEIPVKQPGKLFPLEVDFTGGGSQPGNSDDTEDVDRVKPGSKSKLPKQVQDIIQLIFDVQTMKSTLASMEIDLKKMPLGKVSANMIKEAYKVLATAMDLVVGSNSKGKAKNSRSKTKVLGLSNQFFTLVPHDFGSNPAPLLDNADIIKSKLELLDVLKDIEVATNLLKREDKDADSDPIDGNYGNLHLDMQVLDRGSADFELVEKCALSTHAPTHTGYSLKIDEVFKIQREAEAGENDVFEKTGNKKLLWHGSRLTNYAGILSQGLRIAPPEAPVTGYMFGKGIYFADLISKSANYCAATRQQPTALLVLSEVALGEEYSLLGSEYVERLPEGKQSTKGCGSTVPSEFIPHPSMPDVTLPIGPPVPAKPSGRSELLYNEYIVYDVQQVRLRYLVKVSFDYK